MRVDDDLGALLASPTLEGKEGLRRLYGKLALAMPLGKDGPPPTAYVAWSTLLILAEREIGGIGLCHAWRMPVTATRTCIAETFLNTDCDWLVSIDYDMVFEPSVVFRLALDLLEHPEIRMLSGTARMSGPPHTPAIYLKAGDSWRPLCAWPRQRLFVADRVGLFGNIIHRSVFESIERPWYGGIDECWWFCDKVRTAGIEIWVDPRCSFGHIGERVVEGTPDVWEDSDAA